MYDGRKPDLKIKLFGTPMLELHGACHQSLTGARVVGLVVLLATAPEMRRSRVILVDLLWSDRSTERGRASLRQLLYALHGSVGRDFDSVFETTRDFVALRPEHVRFLGSTRDGDFLEGFDLGQEGFESWLRQERISRHVSPPMKSQGFVSILPRIMVLPFEEVAQSTPTGLGGALAHELTGHFARSQLVDAISFIPRHTTCEESAHLTEETDFVLSGQCRMISGTVTVDANLINLLDRKVVWSHRQKARLNDFLACEDNLTFQIAGRAIRNILPKLTSENAASVWVS